VLPPFFSDPETKTAEDSKNFGCLAICIAYRPMTLCPHFTVGLPFRVGKIVF